MEIYQEDIFDLLSPPSQRKILTVRAVGAEEGDAFKIDGLTEHVVTSQVEVLKLLSSGNSNRKVGVSNLNERSSRSHTIFRLTLESTPKGQDQDEERRGVRVSELNLGQLSSSCFMRMLCQTRPRL